MRYLGRKNKLAQLRWLQVTELKIKYPNDQEFGAEVRKLVNNTPENLLKIVKKILLWVVTGILAYYIDPPFIFCIIYKYNENY